tara:strand:+ start:3351 stop:3746 length:396 start_codon:yes stop_codon:yes gene_type:complete
MTKLLKGLLVAGGLLFTAMAIAHFFSIKVPGLFVYYDTPFYNYQDKVISFAVLAYVALFRIALKHKDVVPYILTVMVATVAGLMYINTSPEFIVLLEEGQSTAPYWAQIINIACYSALLAFAYLRDLKLTK